MSARGPPPRGPPGGGPPRGAPPRGPPPGGGGPPRGAPRGPPPGGGPPRGPPGGGGPPRGPPSGGPPRGPPSGAPPRGPPGGGPPRGPPSGGPPRGPPGGPPPARGAPRGPPGGGPPRGAPPRGAPPRGPPAAGGGPPRGGPPRGPPRGPPGAGGPPRGPPGGPPRGGPPRGPPSGPPRSGPPTAAPPAGMPRGPPGGGGPPGRGPPPRGPPGGGPRGPPPTGPPPRGQGVPGPPPRVPPPPNSQPNQNIAPPSAPPAPKFGRLMVKCLKGVDLKAGQGMFGKADPYAKLRVGTQEYSTKHNAGGGKNPVWNEEFGFDISNEKQLDVEILDKETVGNDKFMGRCTYSIMEWIASGKFDGDLELQDKGGKMVGRITVSVRFERPKGAATQSSTDALDKEIMGALVVQDPNKTGPVQGLSQPPRDPNGKFTDEEIYEAFKAFDLDKNNFIGASEIRHILICMGELITDEEIDMMIAMVDIDGDGQVSFDEFRKLVLHPNPAIMDKDGEANEAKLKEIEDEKLVMAGRANEVDSATYQRQKEMQARDMKKKMITNFLHDHEYDFDSLKMGYNSYLDLPREQRANGNVTFNQFCNLLRIDPINENNRLFGLFDPERSGKVDFREFLLGCFNFVELSRDVRLPLTFHMFDEDKTGYISLNEVRQILRGNHMVSLASIERKAQTMMKQAVANDSNAITLKEFLVVTKKFPNIIIPNLSANGKN